MHLTHSTYLPICVNPLAVPRTNIQVISVCIYIYIYIYIFISYLVGSVFKNGLNRSNSINNPFQIDLKPQFYNFSLWNFRENGRSLTGIGFKLAYRAVTEVTEIYRCMPVYKCRNLYRVIVTLKVWSLNVQVFFLWRIASYNLSCFCSDYLPYMNLKLGSRIRRVFHVGCKIWFSREQFFCSAG